MRYRPRDIRTDTGELVTDGLFNFGTYARPFTIVNPLDARNPLGFPVPRFMKYMRLKEWQAFQIGNERFFLLAVIYNSKAGCLLQFIAYDRKSGRKFAYEKKVLPWMASVPSSLHDSIARTRTRGFSISVRNLLREGKIFIDIAIDAEKKLPPVNAHFEALHEAGKVAPMAVCLPLGKNRAIYSHKCLMPARGELSLGNEKMHFDEKSSFAIIDDHKGYYPYNLRYDWVTGAGFIGKKLVGFNLTANQVIDPEQFNENCLWAGNSLYLLPPVSFQRPDGIEGEWHIGDEYGMIDITFTPVMKNDMHMNYGFAKIDYQGPFGRLRGWIKDSSGKKVPVDNLFGMGERKRVRL
jgi:hypothetical protein